VIISISSPVDSHLNKLILSIIEEIYLKLIIIKLKIRNGFITLQFILLKNSKKELKWQQKHHGIKLKNTALNMENKLFQVQLILAKLSIKLEIVWELLITLFLVGHQYIDLK
jgi:hypothetical protein